jgi:hypothetical protein
LVFRVDWGFACYCFTHVVSFQDHDRYLNCLVTERYTRDCLFDTKAANAMFL